MFCDVCVYYVQCVVVPCVYLHRCTNAMYCSSDVFDFLDFPSGAEGDSGFVGPVPEIKLQSLNSRKEYVYSSH